MRRPAVLVLVAALSLTVAAACRGSQATNAAATAAGAPAAGPAQAGANEPAAFTGTVAETMDSGGYTYVRLQAPGKEDVWIAAREFKTKIGDELTVGLDMPMLTVRGKVVKVNNQILGRNWIHLQDGSGSAEAHTNDLTITTGEVANVGDVVTVKGVLAIDKDFGAGYAYAAIVENARLVK